MKLCIITCYNQPDYIRAKTLRVAANTLEDVEVIVAKNSHTGLLRYFEVFWKVLKLRFTVNPDVYLLTFRGYEMLLPIRLLSAGKTMIYDEFVNPIEWVALEQRQVEAKQNSGKTYATVVTLFSKLVVFVVSSGLFKWFYRGLVNSVDLVLADTDSHAKASAEITGVKRSKVMGIHVGTDETTFKKSQSTEGKNQEFTVFYYGNMLPLHGLDYVIESASVMKGEAVKFVLVGGNSKVAKNVSNAVKNGAKIEYHEWVKFEKLPAMMQQADLCLAGPFGNTFQAQYVITGKSYQYLAMGRPTMIGENEESHNFVNKKNVLIVPKADTDALVDMLHWAMQNKEELSTIGSEGRKLYEEKFSLPHIAEQLKNALSLATK